MSRSRVRSAGLSSRVCRSSTMRTARRPAHDSSARAAVSTESQPSWMGPRAATNADCRWLSSVVVFASQLSARYHATGTLAEAAKPASSVLLPEPAGATTSPTRCCQIRARRASTRSRARDCTCGISTFADTTAVVPSLPLVSPPHLGRPAHASPVRRLRYPFTVLPAAHRRRARYVATLLAHSHLSIWLSLIVQSSIFRTHVCSPTGGQATSLLQTVPVHAIPRPHVVREDRARWSGSELATK